MPTPYSLFLRGPHRNKLLVAIASLVVIVVAAVVWPRGSAPADPSTDQNLSLIHI